MQKSVNSFSKGLNLSQDNINQPKDTYSYALNAVKEDPLNNPSIIYNEKGFSEFIDLGFDYVLVGAINLGLDNYCLFTMNRPGDTPFNRIILIDSDTVTNVFDSLDLNFTQRNPIQSTYRVNYKGDRIVYFVDGLNEDRVINVDSTYLGNVDELSLDVKYTTAVLTSKSINDDGGTLVTGTYEFFMSYKTKDNAVSNWFILNANPIYIIDNNTVNQVGLDNISIDGCDSNLPTNKSITLNIENLDSKYSSFRLGILKTVNGSKQASYVDDIFYNNDTKNYIYTGNSTEVIISDPTELLIDNVRYYGSNAITQIDNRLLRANTSSNKIDIGYQSFANNIVVDYYINEEECGTMANSSDYTIRSNWWQSANTKYTDTKSLLRDEVYSIGIAFGLKNENIETAVYHIPGRPINSIPSGYTYLNQYNDSSYVTYTNWDTDSVTENGETKPKWKLINTAARSTGDIINKLAYYESDEVYPSNMDLPITGSTNTGDGNTNIRHHKMPSSGLEPIFRLQDNGDSFTFYKRHLGLSFSNIQVPDSLKDNISYIRIYISPRDTDQNKSIIAKGIFVNCSLTKINIGDFDTVSTVDYIQPCQPYNDPDDYTNGGCYRAGQDFGWDTIHNYYHSFFSPDTTLKQPTINTNRILIENEFTGIAHYYNTEASLINAPYINGNDGYTDSSSDGGYKRDLFYDDANHGRTLPTGQTSTKAVYNVTGGNFRSTYKSIAILNHINQIQSDKSRRKLKQAVYVPFNSNLSSDQIGDMDNPYNSPYGPANVLLELNTLYDYLGQTETEDTSVNFTDNDFVNNQTDPEQSSDKSGTFHFHTIDDPTVVYRYGSLKRDNSTQYGSIDNIVYHPTDLVIANPTFDDSNILTTNLGGLIGDSWIDMFSIKRCRWVQKEDYTFGGKPEISIGISTFFTESNMNHRLRYAEGIENKQYYPKQILSSSIKPYLDAGVNIDIFIYDNYFKENSDFDILSSKNNIGLSPLDTQLASITNYTTRILYSEKLFNEDISDSFRVFLANNYIDLPKDTGFISNMFKRGQELYTTTRDSLWRVYASNETVKTNDTDLTIGNAEFFSLEPTEVLSIKGGFAGSSSKLSLSETPYGYFFVDKNKGKFILFKDRQGYYDNSQQNDISLQGVYNFTKDNFKLSNDSQTFDNPLLYSGYLSGYDPYLKRLLITKLDYTLTTDQINHFVGIFDPEEVYNSGDIYLKDDGNYYTFNSSTSDWTTVAESSDLSDFTSTQVDNISFTYTTPTNGTITDLNPILRYTPTIDYVGSDTFNVFMNCGFTEVDVTIVAAPPEHLVVYAQYGMTITSVADDTTSGIPSDLNSISVTPGNTLSDTYTTITSGQFRVNITGIVPSGLVGRLQLYVSIDGTTVSTANVLGAGLYGLTLPSSVTSPQNILIGLQTT